MILRCFAEVSGLSINLSKSTLFGINIAEEKVKDLGRSLNCNTSKLPFIYLGLPVGGNMG